MAENKAEVFHFSNPAIRLVREDASHDWRGVEESESKPCLMAALPSVEIVRLLLEAGANPHSTYDWKEMAWHKQTVLSVAEGRSAHDPAFLEIARLLKEHANKS